MPNWLVFPIILVAVAFAYWIVLPLVLFIFGFRDESIRDSIRWAWRDRKERHYTNKRRRQKERREELRGWVKRKRKIDELYGYQSPKKEGEVK